MKLTLPKYGFIDANHFWYGGIFQHDQNYMIFYDLFKTSIAQTWTQLTNSPIYNNMKTGDIQIEDNGEKLDVDYINKFEIVPLLSLPKYAHPSSFKPHISMYQIHWNFRLLGNKMLRGRLTTAQVEQDMRSAHGPDDRSVHEGITWDPNGSSSFVSHAAFARASSHIFTCTGILSADIARE